MVPYRWLPRTFFANISWIFYSIKRGIKNTVRWTPVIWDDEDFDWAHLATIMEVKMRWMSKYIKEEEWATDSGEISRELLICAELLKRLINDDMGEMEINRGNILRHNQRMKEWGIMLGDIIGKKLRYWWT